MRKLFLYIPLLLVACGTDSSILFKIETKDPTILRKTMQQCMEMDNTYFHIEQQTLGASDDYKLRFIGFCHSHLTPWKNSEANND